MTQTGPIASAFVEAQLDTSAAEKDLKAFVQSLDQQVGRAADSAEKAIVSAFRDAAQTSARALNDLTSGNLFKPLGTDAQTSARAIEEAFAGAQKQSDAQLKEIGGAGTFAPVGREAKATADTVVTAFSTAQTESDAQLAEIGGPGTFRTVEREADAAGRKVSTSFKNASTQADQSFGSFVSHARTGALIVGAAVAGIGSVALFKTIHTGIQELSDASAGAAQLAAGIASTGNKANVTVPQLEALASSIQGYSGQTDDSVVAGEQLLLTFTNIRNGVGKGNDIFNQATTALTDMAAKLGTDAPSAAIQLGKALNDPVKGIAALSRVGVSFTAQQKEQVKQMVATGDTVGAQKLILHELTTEFGGAAAAAGQSLPGQLAIAKRAFEDFSQTLIQTVAPAFTPIIGMLAHELPGLAPGISAALKPIGPTIASVIQAIGPILNGLSTGLTAVFNGISGAVGALAPDLGFLAAELGQAFKPIQTVLPLVARALAPLLGLFGELARTLLPPFINIIGALARALTPVIGLLSDRLTTVLADQIAPILPDLVDAFAKIADSLAQVLVALLPVIPPLAHLAVLLIDKLGVPALLAIAGALTAVAAVINTLQDVGLLTPLIVTLTGAFLAWKLAVVGVPALIDAIGVAMTILDAILAANPIVLIAAAIVALGVAFIVAYKKIGPFHDAVDAIGRLFASVGTAVADFAKGLFDNLQPVFSFLVDHWKLVLGVVAPFVLLGIEIVQHWSAVSAFFSTVFGPVLQGLVTALTFLWQNVLLPLGTFVGTVLIAYFRAYVTVLLFLWNNVLVPFIGFVSGTVLPILMSIGQFVGGVLVAAFNALSTAVTFVWQNIIQPFIGFLQGPGLTILRVVAAVIVGPLVIAVASLIKWVTFLWQNVFQPYISFVSAVFLPVLSAVAGFLRGVFSAAFNAVSTVAGFLWHSVLSPIASFLRSVFVGALDIVRAGWDRFRGAVDLIKGSIQTVWHTFLEPIANFLRGALKSALGIAQSAFDDFRTIAVDPLVSVLQTLLDLLGRIKDIAGGVISKIGDIASKIPGLGTLKSIIGFSTGGIGDFGADGTPAILHGREAILPLDDTKRSLELLSQSGLFKQPKSAPVRSSAATPSIVTGASTLAGNIEVKIIQHFPAGTDRATIDAAAKAGADAVDEVLTRQQLEFVARTS